MAMSSVLPRLLLLISPRVLYHVFDNALHHVCVLESLPTEAQLHPYHKTSTLQLLAL